MVLREWQTSIEVSKEKKQGLETKVRVLEKLRKKVQFLWTLIIWNIDR
jgi:hypothetical protein